MSSNSSQLVQGYLTRVLLAAGAAVQPKAGQPTAPLRPPARHLAAALAGGAALARQEAAASPPEGRLAAATYIPLPFAPPAAAAFGSGGRLPHDLRSRAEDYFGADLGGLQLYSSPRLPGHGARALTLGSRLIFAPGAGDPSHPAGRALIAHELAHVVQQRRGRVPPPPRPGFFLFRDPRLEAEAQAAGQSLGSWRAGALQARLLPPQQRRGAGVLQAAHGTWYNNGRLEARELHGTSRGDSAIFLRGGDNEAYLTYDLEADGTTVIIPHLEALNFESGHGAGWKLFQAFAEHALSLGRTHVRLGTAVYRNPSNTHGPTNAAVHIYETLGFDVTSSRSVLASRPSLTQVRDRAAQNALRYHWAPGRLPTATTPLVADGSGSSSGGCFPNCRCYLTTACVVHRGLPIDGEELTVLRHLRDGYMSRTRSRRRSLERYYATAPEIVRQLASSPERDDAYAWIHEVLRRCVGLLREGGQAGASRVYGQAATALEKRYLAAARPAPELPAPAALF